VFAKLEDPNLLKTDPKTEKAIQDLRKISFNHLAPLIDNLLNLSKENEQLLKQLEISKHEVKQKPNLCAVEYLNPKTK
jgi:hypothetical protein